MNKRVKLQQKLLSGSPITWDELESLLKSLGFRKREGPGSRVKFEKAGKIINLHKPHPRREVKHYALRQVKEWLEAENEI